MVNLLLISGPLLWALQNICTFNFFVNVPLLSNLMFNNFLYCVAGEGGCKERDGYITTLLCGVLY